MSDYIRLPKCGSEVITYTKYINSGQTDGNTVNYNIEVPEVSTTWHNTTSLHQFLTSAALTISDDTVTGITIHGQTYSFSGSSSGGDFNLLINRPKYNGTEMTSATNIPEVPTNYVTTDTIQTISKPKIIKGLDSDDGTSQNALLRILNTTDSTTSDAVWKGRIIAGAKNKTFLMGTYKGMCGIGAHHWTDSAAGTGAGWENFYLNPDGSASVYIGWATNGWSTSDTGILKIDNSTHKAYYKGVELANVNQLYTHPAGSAPSKSLGLYKFSTDATSHINSTSAVEAGDIPDLPASKITSGKLSNDRINLDSALSDSSTNPVQNNAIKAEIDNVREVAAGKTASYVTNTTQMPSLNVQTASVTVTSFKDESGTTIPIANFKKGDNVYITNTDVPDRWVSAVTASNITLSILETNKPTVTGADRGLTVVNNKVGHSNVAVTAVTVNSFLKIAYDAYGHITGSTAVTASDIPDLSSIYVTLSGTQTITGIKTFDNNSVIKFYNSTDDSAHQYYTAISYKHIYIRDQANGQDIDLSYNYLKLVDLLGGNKVTYYKAGKINNSGVDLVLPTTAGTIALTTDIPDVSGKVSGPASSIDNAIARFDSTTGKLIQNSNATIDDSGNGQFNGYINALGGIKYLTTAPTSANTKGGLIPVVLSSEPTTKYDGYIYLIKQSS